MSYDIRAEYFKRWFWGLRTLKAHISSIRNYFYFILSLIFSKLVCDFNKMLQFKKYGISYEPLLDDSLECTSCRQLPRKSLRCFWACSLITEKFMKEMHGWLVLTFLREKRTSRACFVLCESNAIFFLSLQSLLIILVILLT